MPELPEVEFARRSLESWLGGKKLAAVEAERTRVLRGSTPEALAELAGHRVRAIDRRGKWLLWRLDGGLGLLSHLGMTGKFVLRRRHEPPPRWSRAHFLRSDGAAIHYQDQRMFGRLLPGPLAELEEEDVWRTLGPDAWESLPKPKEWRAILSSRRRAIKDVLSDQTVVAGLGNIQSTEALFMAQIHPARPAAELTDDEVRRLTLAIRRTLERTLKLDEGREGDIAYVEEGTEENPFLVYGRAGESCPRCGTTLEKRTIGGRTTAFCPKCQPA